MPASAAPRIVVACCSVVDGGLALLLRGGSGREAERLPQAPVPRSGTLEPVADRLVIQAAGVAPTWRAQGGVLLEGGLTVVVAAMVPMGTTPSAGHRWVPVARAKAEAAAALRLALGVIRDRLDQDPIAFRLLPSPFALGELQQVYELLLGRRLHKASFRRALLAAHLVAPTDEWRSEGRGRPAQLYRYHPRRRRPGQRPLRFELLH